jgi:hypothetical protein
MDNKFSRSVHLFKSKSLLHFISYLIWNFHLPSLICTDLADQIIDFFFLAIMKIYCLDFTTYLYFFIELLGLKE